MLKLRIGLLFLFTLLVSLFLYSQNNKIDSLLLVSKTIQENKAKVDLFNELIREYRSSKKFQKAIEYSKKSIKTAKKLNYLEGEAIAYKEKGTISFYQKNYKEAISYYNQALLISKRIENQELEALVYFNLGASQQQLSEFILALDSYEKALGIQEKIDNKKRVLDILNNIGNIYQKIGLYDKAIDCQKKAVKISLEMSDKIMLLYAYNNLGTIYEKTGFHKQALVYYNKSLNLLASDNKQENIEAYLLNNIGSIYLKNENNDTALFYFERSYRLSNQLNDQYSKAYSLHNLGNVFYLKNNLSKAMSYLNQSLLIKKEIRDKPGIANTLSLMASIHKSLNNKKAIEYYKTSLEIAELLDLKEIMQNNYKDLSDIYIKNGDNKTAIEYYKQYTAVKDSLLSIDVLNKLNKMTIEFEIAKKEQEIINKDREIDLLKTKEKANRLKWYIVIIGSLFIIIIGLFVYNWQRLKIKKSKIELNYKNKELMNSVIHVIQKNDFLSDLKKEIESIKNEKNGKIELNKLSSFISYNLNIDKNRQELQILIEKETASFFVKLHQKYPNLTEKEKRLASLLMLELSSKEIAIILNISKDSVNTSRYRLRKKLQIPSEKDLYTYLKNM
jgi:tetratricopeptide (TPR) repeat protein